MADESILEKAFNDSFFLKTESYLKYFEKIVIHFTINFLIILYKFKTQRLFLHVGYNVDNYFVVIVVMDPT